MSETQTEAIPEHLPTRWRDGRGRDWTLELNVALARRARGELELDLLNLHDGKAIAALADPEKLVDCLWLLCEEQAAKREVGAGEFAAGLGGDAFDAAAEALENALVNFTRRGDRPVIRTLLERVREVQRRGTELAVRKIAGPGADRMIEAQLGRAERRMDQELSRRLREATDGDSSLGSPAN